MKKIFIILPKYKIGGAERVMEILANQLALYNLDIYFVILTRSNQLNLNKKINLINLNSKSVIRSILRLKGLIDEFKPDVCLATISHTNIALYFASILAKHNSKIFLRESNNLFESINYKNFIYRFIFISLVKFSYRRNILISPSKKLTQAIRKSFDIKEKIFTIENPITIENNQKIYRKKYDFINIASLTFQKDHITLLKAFKIALSKKKNLKLLIIGEGILKFKIMKFIINNKLNNNVTIIKNNKKIFKYLSESKNFILTSKYEGYPNVLLDAAISKIPIISTDCKFGPTEILDYGRYGKLFKVGDYIKLSQLMISKKNSIKVIPIHKLKKNRIDIVSAKYYELFFKKYI